MTTRKGLKDSLKRQRQRLPHGYELVARKKKTAKKKTVRKATAKRKTGKKRRVSHRETGWFG